MNELGRCEGARAERLGPGARSLHGWLTVREVHDVLARDRDIAYTTVMTVLDRMAHKDLVEREREGRAWRYRPTQSRGSMTAEVMRQALGEFADVRNKRDREAALCSTRAEWRSTS